MRPPPAINLYRRHLSGPGSIEEIREIFSEVRQGHLAGGGKESRKLQLPIDKVVCIRPDIGKAFRKHMEANKQSRQDRGHAVAAPSYPPAKASLSRRDLFVTLLQFLRPTSCACCPPRTGCRNNNPRSLLFGVLPEPVHCKPCSEAKKSPRINAFPRGVPEGKEFPQEAPSNPVPGMSTAPPRGRPS